MASAPKVTLIPAVGAFVLITSGNKAELQQRLGEHEAQVAADNVKKEDDIAPVKRAHSEESEGIQAKRIKEGYHTSMSM